MIIPVPTIIATAGLVPLEDDFQFTPPIWWHSFADDWAAESGTGTVGRYHKESGELRGTYQVNWADGWHITGDGLTGARSMDRVVGNAGVWVAYNTAGPAGTPSGANQISNVGGAGNPASAYEILQHAAGAGLAPLWFTFTHSGCDSGAPTAADTYVYLELAYGDPNVNIRLAYEWGSPVRLDIMSVDTGNVWLPLAVLSGPHADTEVFKDVPDQSGFVATIYPNPRTGVLCVETTKGVARISMPPLSRGASVATGGLPSAERYRLVTRGLYGYFYAYPMKFKPITVTKSKLAVGFPVDVSQAQAIVNVAGSPNASQVDTVTPTQNADGSIKFTATSTLPDDGSGLGSADAPVLSDVLIYIPSRWDSAAIGYPVPEALLKVMRVEETQVWDDANRLGRCSGRIYLQNSDHRYDGALGHFALSVAAGNGTVFAQRFRGVMGTGRTGIANYYTATARWTCLEFSDFMIKLERPLEQEILLDGFALSTAIRLLLDIGQISPKFLQSLPELAFPPYADGFPDWILPKGTGLDPRMRFMPDALVIEVLAELLRCAGYVDPVTGLSAPLYMSFDPWGQFNVGPYNPLGMPIVKQYSTVDHTGQGLINGEPMVSANSAENIRTHIVIQGQDALSYELLQVHEELPWNYPIVGWRRGALERNARYGTVPQMVQAAYTMAVTASLGTNIVQIRVPFDATVNAGDLVSISDPALGTAVYTVMRLENFYGLQALNSADGYCDSYSLVTCRGVVNSMVPGSF